MSKKLLLSLITTSFIISMFLYPFAKSNDRPGYHKVLTSYCVINDKRTPVEFCPKDSEIIEEIVYEKIYNIQDN